MINTESLPCKLPAHAYVFGQNYEIRDPQNRVIIRFQVLKGDLQYRKNMQRLTQVIADLLSGNSWVESGENGYKLLGFGSSENTIEASPPRPETIVAPIAKDEVVSPVPFVEQEEEEGTVGGFKPSEVVEHQRRKPGRPKKGS